MEVISADRLHECKIGVAETTNIVTVLMSNNKKGTCVISDEALD